MNKLLSLTLLAALCTVGLTVPVQNCPTAQRDTKTSGANTVDICKNCGDGFYPGKDADGDITSCTACDLDDCVSCPAANQCATCASGFYGAGTKGAYTSCEACTVIDGCTTCSSKTTCTSCSDGQGVKSDGTCGACAVSNCATCPTDNTRCATCATGYNFDASSTAAKPVCSLCSNNCKTCGTKIDQSCGSDGCQTGLTLNNTDKANMFCCAKDCVQCSSASVCEKCKDGVNLNEDTDACFGFKTGASLTLGAVISVALFSLLF